MCHRSNIKLLPGLNKLRITNELFRKCKLNWGRLQLYATIGNRNKFNCFASPIHIIYLPLSLYFHKDFLANHRVFHNVIHSEIVRHSLQEFSHLLTRWSICTLVIFTELSEYVSQPCSFRASFPASLSTCPFLAVRVSHSLVFQNTSIKAATIWGFALLPRHVAWCSFMGGVHSAVF